MSTPTDPWHLSPGQENEALYFFESFQVADAQQRLCAYKGKLDDVEVVVIGAYVPQPNGLMSSIPLAIVSDELLKRIVIDGAPTK